MSSSFSIESEEVITLPNLDDFGRVEGVSKMGLDFSTHSFLNAIKVPATSSWTEFLELPLIKDCLSVFETGQVTFVSFYSHFGLQPMMSRNVFLRSWPCRCSATTPNMRYLRCQRRVGQSGGCKVALELSTVRGEGEGLPLPQLSTPDIGSCLLTSSISL